ncbi:hypothetical protein Tco_1454975 [Tanacetum coccineum]
MDKEVIDSGCSRHMIGNRSYLTDYEENLYVKFSEDTPNIARSKPKWLFDIDALTKSMNYEPVVVGNQSNGNAGIKAFDDVGFS